MLKTILALLLLAVPCCAKVRKPAAIHKIKHPKIKKY